jgi:hypothetical protein
MVFQVQLLPILDCGSLTCENGPMTVNEPLILYSRADCHLCDQVVLMMDQAGVSWRPVDIDGDPELARIYGLRVPVLKHPASGRELFYPFGEDQMLKFYEGGA